MLRRWVVCGAVGMAVVTGLFGSTALAASKTINWLACKTPVQLEGFKKLFDEFQKDTGTKVVVTPSDWGSYMSKLLLNIAAGRMTEFFATGTDFVPYANAKAIVALDKYVKADKFNLADQNKPAMNSFKWKGQQWAIPYGFYPVVLYYNKNLFDQAGLTYPTSNWEDRSWNWDSFVDVAKKLTKTGANGKPTQVGIAGMQWHYFWPWYFGGDWCDVDASKATLNDPKTLRGIQEVVDLFLKYKIAGGDGMGFENAKAAMTIDGNWSMSSFTKINKFKWNIAATPIGTQHSVPAFVDGFSVGYSKNSAEMWKFIKWMYADKERVRRWLDYDSNGSAVPTDKTLLAKYLSHGKQENPGVNLQVCVDALDYATPVYLRYSKNWPKISQMIDPAMALVTSGKKSAREAIELLNAQVDKLLKAVK